MFIARLIAAAAVALLLGGCAGAPPLRSLPHGAASVELAATPFFAQELHQCGPAALATVLAADGVAVTPEDLAPKVYLPGREGSLQTELVAATRGYGRVPYPLTGGLDALLAEVAAGHPVLVLQNLLVKSWPRWHYAVVVGFDPDADELILRSGREARLRMGTRAFLRTWQLAEQWALVVAQPDAIPPSADAPDWLAAAADFEALQQPALAARAYAAAVARWPEQPLAWAALANARYAQRDLAGAAQALGRAAQLAPGDAAVHNNYAQVLAEQGCTEHARGELDKARGLASPQQQAAIDDTARAISRAARAPCPD